MPLIKKQSGWFWGSKGPFDTKAKALSVARAAYAHGYKESIADTMPLYVSESTSTKKVCRLLQKDFA